MYHLIVKSQQETFDNQSINYYHYQIKSTEKDDNALHRTHHKQCIRKAIELEVHFVPACKNDRTT